jgi:hypothetical protein
MTETKKAKTNYGNKTKIKRSKKAGHAKGKVWYRSELIRKIFRVVPFFPLPSSA